MSGKSRASQMVIDQEPSITHRRSKPQTALAVRGDVPHDDKPPAKKWIPARIGQASKSGWIPAYMRRSTVIEDAIDWCDVPDQSQSFCRR